MKIINFIKENWESLITVTLLLSVVAVGVIGLAIDFGFIEIDKVAVVETQEIVISEKAELYADLFEELAEAGKEYKVWAKESGYNQ